MTDHSEAAAVYTELRDRIGTWRRQAKLACALSPMHWIAVHGVSLVDYPATLDKFDEQCVAALAMLQPQEGAA